MFLKAMLGRGVASVTATDTDEGGSNKFKKKQLSADDVISKLKDDGDFDRLRHTIIHKLKSNISSRISFRIPLVHGRKPDTSLREDLRNSIISIVKQSVALNRVGAEKLKPRQLFDSIHKEIEKEVMGQISDGVWEIIRSNDGMKKEIAETVESVYEKLTNTQKGKEAPEDIPMPSPDEQPPKASEEAVNDIILPPAVPSIEVNASCDGSEPNEPPGFSLSNQKQTDIQEGSEGQPCDPPHEESKEHEVTEVQPQDVADDSYSSPTEPLPDFPPTFVGKPSHSSDSDSDPDVPPGFGWTIQHHISSSK